MQQDIWHFPRTQLASQVLGMFETGLSSALTFFAPRRMGKTEFLRKDIAPLAESKAWHVFYFSFLDAGDAVTADFTQALAKFTRPENWLKRTGKALGVSKISGNVAGLEAGVELQATNKKSEDIKTLIAELAGRKDLVLLLLDEVQTLAERNHNQFVAALRTALDLHKDNIKVIFTGSSREGLRRMFSQATAPFFHFGQNLVFPELGRAFTEHLANTFNITTQRILNQDALWFAFQEMGKVPQLARSLVERLALNPGLTIEEATNSLISEVNAGRNYIRHWEQCSALERLILQEIVAGHSELYSLIVRREFAERLGVSDMPVSSVQSALRTLVRRSIIFKQEGLNNYEIEDAMFVHWLQHGIEA